jgi:transcription termination/antitermination protein NusG
MSDENKPIDEHAKSPPEGTATPAEAPPIDSAPADTHPPLPPATLYAEPHAMAETAANVPAQESSADEHAPEAEHASLAPPVEEEPETPELPPHEAEALTAPEAETAPADEVAEAESKPESEAPKPKKPRKSKTAATGADGPSDAPASTDPNAAPAATGTGQAGESGKKWYVVKVQSGREDSIKAAIERKVKIEGLEQFFGQIAIPVEELVVKKSVKVKDKKTGDKVTQEKQVIKHQKKYPGYLFAEVEFNDRILYLFRETSGVGDFVGAGLKREPTPMTDREVTQMLTGVVDKDAKKGQKGPMKVKLDIEKGDKVKIRDGAFANMEGEVKAISEAKEDAETPKVTVVVTIFGRPVEVELDYWHVDKV